MTVTHRATALIAAGLLALLTACGTAEAPAGPAPGPSSEPGPVEVGAGAAPGDALTGELTVFAAASLQVVFDELAGIFAERHPGVTVAPIVYDGSPTLVTQLLEGASADVLATADERTMATLVEAGLVAGDPGRFATNSLRIAVAPDNPHGVTGLADVAALLAAGGRVAVCAPEVPCGAAADRVLAAAGVSLAGASQEQSVSAVLSKVAAQEADAGLVYATDVARAAGAVRGIEFPEAALAVNAYPVAVLAGSPDPGPARAFVELVLSEEGAAVLAAHGFGAP